MMVNRTPAQKSGPRVSGCVQTTSTARMLQRYATHHVIESCCATWRFHTYPTTSPQMIYVIIPKGPKSVYACARRFEAGSQTHDGLDTGPVTAGKPSPRGIKSNGIR